MYSINEVELLGNLTADPDCKFVGESPVANFSVACNSKWTAKNGEKKERTEFINVVVWGPMATILGDNLNKGDKILLKGGEIRTRSWEGDGGKKQYRTEVVFSGPKADFAFVGGKRDGGSKKTSGDYQQSYK